MAQLRLNCNKSAKISGMPDGVSPETNYSTDQYATGLNAGALLLGFPSASTLGNKKINSVSFHAFIIPYVKHDAYTGYDNVQNTQLRPYALEGGWTENTVTWNTQPNHGVRGWLITSGSNVAGGMYVEGSYSVVTDIAMEYLRNVLSYGLYCEVGAYEYYAIDGAKVATSRAPSAQIPYLVIDYDDTPVTLHVSAAPRSGNYPKVKDTYFSWSASYYGDSLEEVNATNYKFRWRPGGETEYTEIDCGTSTSYTVPANTFTTDTIEWQVAVTDNFGTVTTSSWYTIATSDVLYSCEILSPEDEIIDGSQPIPIQFRVNNTTGLTPESLRFDFSTASGSWRGWTVPGTRWTSWATSGLTRTYAMNNVPEYMPTGEMMLRLYVNNSEGVAGPASIVTVTRVAAPPAPSVSVEAIPKAVVRWQGSGQLAYKVTIDGTVYGPYFGTANSFTLPELLEDGVHTATVEIQGEYGLWSEPGSYTFTVANSTPGTTLTLIGSADIDAVLTLQPSWDGPYSFWIYRDGKKISVTGESQYIDRLSLGEHHYTVRAVFSSGNYCESNSVTLTPVCRTMAIMPVEEGGAWLRCETSVNSSRFERYSYSKTHSLRHFRGAKYPVLELSGFEDLRGSFECGFMDREQAERFWALRGRIVIVKARGEVLIGLMANVTKARSEFLYSFTFELARIDWEGLDA